MRFKIEAYLFCKGINGKQMDISVEVDEGIQLLTLENLIEAALSTCADSATMWLDGEEDRMDSVGQTVIVTVSYDEYSFMLMHDYSFIKGEGASNRYGLSVNGEGSKNINGDWYAELMDWLWTIYEEEKARG